MIRAVFTAVASLSIISATYAADDSGLAGWNYQSLRDDIRLSELLDHDVMSADQRRIGQVRDVTIGADGNFDAFVVEFDTGADGSGFALARMAWSDATLEPGNRSITVGIEPAASVTGEPVTADTVQDASVPARQVIGMPVDLADRESFGQVTDILVDRASTQPSALLVDADGFIFALPVRAHGIDSVDERIRYPFSADSVQDLGAYAKREQ